MSSMEREAEILEMPTQEESNVSQARRVAQGRAAVERYVERLENATQGVHAGPEASELYCAQAELREGMIEQEPALAEELYQQALDAFKFSHVANLGLRRLHRASGNHQAALALLERELMAAKSKRQKLLRLELARTILYNAQDSERCLALIEEWQAEEQAARAEEQAVQVAQELKPELEQGVEEGGFHAERFYLLRDALSAAGAWERYENLLRDALKQQAAQDPLALSIQEELWMLYRSLLAERNQADILCKHLTQQRGLTDEWVDEGLERTRRLGLRDEQVDLLSQALESEKRGSHELFYRLSLADIAHYDYEDLGHANDILKEGLEGGPSKLIVVDKLLSLSRERGDKAALLEALTQSLECMQAAEDKAQQLHAIACILRDDMEQDEAALDVFLEANAICPSYGPTLEALDEIYRRKGQWADLAKILEFELSYVSERESQAYTAELYRFKHAQLAWIYESKLKFSLKAFNHYQAILKHRADDLAALKGASRMTQQIGNWPDLLKLYAAAEACTQDADEHAYLLERIAWIAEQELDEPNTACTALEALRDLGEQRQRRDSALARLYQRLEKWEELLALSEAELSPALSTEYTASLLYRCGELAEVELKDLDRALTYYERVRQVQPKHAQAFLALQRLYEQQGQWRKLADLLRQQAKLVHDPKLKCIHWHKLAKLLLQELDEVEEAIEVFQACLQQDARDFWAIQSLIELYEQEGRWSELLEILSLELAAGGAFGRAWLSHYRMAEIELFRQGSQERALTHYTDALLASPNKLELFLTWRQLILDLQKIEAALPILEHLKEESSSGQMRFECLRTQIDFSLRLKPDLRSVQEYFEELTLPEGQSQVLLTQLQSLIYAQQGQWAERLATVFLQEHPASMRQHALEASWILSMPAFYRAEAQSALVEEGDSAFALRLWSSLAPALRPSYKLLPKAFFGLASAEAQDLRRWASISRLLNGEISDPTERLLTDSRNANISYRPDLELLAAYFERFEKWLKLLEVLQVQAENTLNEQERIQLSLQQAWVLSKLRRSEEALACVRSACQSCSYHNPMRQALYDYLVREEDWDFVAEQIRQQLMHSEEGAIRAALWMRLADIYGTGMGNPEESLRCLDQAYRAHPADGRILRDISKTAERIAEFDIARRALDDYLSYHQPSLEEQFELESSLLRLHFQRSGGDIPRMLHYFAELADQSAQSRECLSILAKAHAFAGDPQFAAELILRLVSYPFEDQDLELWMILADLYLQRLNEASKGEELLWKLFASYPSYEGLFEKLNALYQRSAERRIFVENLRNAVKTSPVIASDGKLVRRFLSIAAQILGSELGLWRDAQELYSQALEVSGEASEDLVKNRAYARCRVPGEAASAYAEFCQLLVNDPFQEDIYRAAIDICRRNEAHDRARILKHLAQFFIPEQGLHRDGESIRPKLMDARVLSDAILQQHLCHPSLRPMQSVLHEAMPILSNAFKDLIPKRTHLGGERIKTPQIQELFATASAAFGVHGIRGFYGHDDSPVPVVFDEPASYWIAREPWEKMSLEAQRHWAGYASGMLWTGVSQLLYFDPLQLWRLLDGIYYTITGQGIQSRNAYTIEAAERVDATFTRGQRKEVSRLIDALGPNKPRAEEASTWLEGVYHSADRAGLLFSGNFVDSMMAILQAEGWNPEKQDGHYLRTCFNRTRRLPELIAFGLSDDYLQLRYHAGLSIRPSVIRG